MKARDTSKWQSRGNLRRAHPASGATWNVQVVRGKMTSRCLWHACRALILGMALMLLGGGMATIGYYANDFTVGAEFKGNATVRVKNEHRGLHLNNLSYVGPIIMGVGGKLWTESKVNYLKEYNTQDTKEEIIMNIIASKFLMFQLEAWNIF